MALEILTHTKRRDFQNCPRYFLHKHLEHLVPRSQRGGRRRGTIFGSAIDSASKLHAENPSIFEEASRSAYLMEFVEAAYDSVVETENIDGHEIVELEVEAVKVAVMADLYIERYGYDVRRELEFYLPLRNPVTNRTSRAFQLGGKIDGIARTYTREDGTKVAVMIEDKFVQSIQRAMILRLPLDAQISEYVDAFNSRGWAAEVMYRHTRFPGMNPKKAKEFKTKPNYPGETLEEFAERLREDVIEKPESYFDQQTLYFPIDHLDDYSNGRWGIAQDIIAKRRVYRQHKSNEFWAPENVPQVQRAFPMNSSRCWEYGGCEFIPLCTRQEGARDLYVVQEDNPELSHGKGDEGVTSEYGPAS